MVRAQWPCSAWRSFPHLKSEIIRGTSPRLLKSVMRTGIRTLPQNRAALLAALPGKLEDAHDPHGIFGSNGQRRTSENGVAHIGIEVAVIAGGRGDMPPRK